MSNTKEKPKATDLHDFVATDDGWVNGQRVKKGDVVRLTLAAAKYENVTPKTPASKPTKAADGK